MQDQFIRGYTCVSKTWYGSYVLENMGPDICEMFIVGMYNANTIKPLGEFSIIWFKHQGKVIPKVEMIDSGWKAFHTSGILSALVQAEHVGNTSPDDIEQLLLNLNFINVTQQEQSSDLDY